MARLAAAVRLSVRTGCSLAAVVGAVEDDLRARRRHRLELRSAVAGPRASAALLAALPLLAMLMGGGVGADPWRVLTTTGTGSDAYARSWNRPGIRRNRRVLLPLPNLPSPSRTAHNRSPANPRSPTSAAGTTSPSIDFTG